MIWVGRILSIPVGVLLFISLLVTLVVLEVQDTFLDPGFYPEELRKADIYEFVLNDLLTSALDEAREKEPEYFADELSENPIVTTGLATEDIVASVNRAVPPEWVQGLVEQSFDQSGRYLTGESDEFAVTVRAGEQVAILVEEVRYLLRKADAYNLLYDELVTPSVEDALAQGDLPLGVEVTPDRLVSAIRVVAPPDWVQAQVEHVLDEVTPYLVGERDTFEISVNLSDERVRTALEEIKKLLREVDAYELLYPKVVEPAVLDNLDDAVELQYGIIVTPEEVVSALRRVAPVEWVQEQVETLIDDAGLYLAGRADSFQTSISLVDNKREASAVLVETVDAKLSDIVEGIPLCTPAQLRAGAGTDSLGLPACIPPGAPFDRFERQVQATINDQVDRLVLGPIPDTVTFSNSQIRDALVQAGAGANVDVVDDVREVLRDGWRYTDADLREDLQTNLGDWAIEDLEDARMFLADGWTYTRADLEEDLINESGTSIDDLDTGRGLFKAARDFRWIVYVPLIILLVSIGFMGGVGWSGRVMYGAGALLVVAGAIFLIFGPGYDSFAKSGPAYQAFGVTGIDELRQDALDEIGATDDFPRTARLAANKVFDTLESVADGFAGGVAQSGLNLAIIGLVVLLTAMFWDIISRVLRSTWNDIYPGLRCRLGS